VRPGAISPTVRRAVATEWAFRAAATFRAEFFVPVADDPEQEALAAYGNVAAHARLPLAMAVLDDVVFPGLDAAGVPTEAARVWRRERVFGRPGEGPA